MAGRDFMHESSGGGVGRWLALLGGGALVGYAWMHRRKRVGLGSALAGSALVFRGISGASSEKSEEPEVESGTSQATVTILRDAHELYEFWADPNNHPRFMEHVQSVKETSPGIWHWKIESPFGAWEWDAATEKQRGRRISWRTLPGAKMPNSGSVEFTQRNDGRGTEVRLTMAHDFPAGKAGEALAMVLGRHPSQSAREGLRRFKQLLETGEIATTLGQPAGKRGVRGNLMETMLGEETRQSA